jgi:endonuclease/exonuclease/phosphatase family metal-dependent hydrolase
VSGWPTATNENGIFRVVTYNLENYLDKTAKKGSVKSPESKLKIREFLGAIRPDVIALQEIGSTNTLHELRASLASERLDFPHWEHVAGSDEDLHVAVLSKFPFAGRRPHVEERYTQNGQSFRVRRGFAEVDVQVNPRFSFTLFAAHLKSKNENAQVGADVLRLEEARLLREIIDVRLKKSPDAKIVVCGDFNDTKKSRVVRTIVGAGKHRLVDALPQASGGEAWTNYFEEGGRYERIDFMLMNLAMARCWRSERSGVYESPDWKLASDHRPVIAAFCAL